MIHTQRSTESFSVANTNPWGGELVRGSVFSYRSIPCTGPAPVNNIASNLPTYNGMIPGSRAPSSMRAHPFSMQLVRSKRRGWEMPGLITFTVCKLSGGPTAAPDPIPDEQKPKIFMRYRAKPVKVNGEVARFSGTVRIAGGTQRYQDLRGEGELSGYFFCFAPEGCVASGGKYQDGQMSIQGRYSDPTPQLGG